MKALFSFLGLIYLSLQSSITFSQQPRFNLLATDENNNWRTIADIKQDPQGYIWLSTQLKGLQRYDGSRFTSYMNEPRNTNSLANNRVPCIYIDSTGIIWAATYGSGLDKFDPQKNSFRHFRHDPNDPASLANDTVFIVIRDHVNNLWVGTYGGLDMFDEKTGKFVHYKNIPGDASSLSYNRVWYIYEDRQGTLWIGCGSPFFNMGEGIEDGGLNRFDRATGKFTRYLHDANDSNSITHNKVRAIFEDSKGNFWVGSAGDGLQILDRATGKFTHYYYDPDHPEKLSRPPVKDYLVGVDHITFIREDLNGSIWIGSLLNGMNKYDPNTKKTTHFGLDLDLATNKILSAKDTTTGFRDFATWRALVSKDGLLWISTSMGSLYNIDVSTKLTIPYYPISQPEANSFYYEADKNILWIGTLKGLVRKDLNAQTEKSWVHDPLNSKSLCNDSIASIKADERGNLWIATMNGLSKFNFTKESFNNYLHTDKDPGSISGNSVTCLFADTNKNIWASTGEWIIDKFDPKTNSFTHYKYSESTNIQNSFPYASAIAVDNNNDLWIASTGLVKLDHRDGKFYNYLPNTNIVALCIDATNTVWAGASNALYRYDRVHDQFSSFVDPNTRSQFAGIFHILEDDHQNLWISTPGAIVKINANRDAVSSYGQRYGVHKNTFVVADNYKGKNGKLFFGDQTGYYAFFPEMLLENNTAPNVNFTSFKIADIELNGGNNEILKRPLWQTKEIELNYNQNTFSIDFHAIDYKNPGEIKYLFMLENYDNNWHYTGTEHKAYLFNIPPGKYVFKVKAVNSDSSWSEKTLAIVISPPWWRTSWAYAIFAFIFIAAMWGIIQYRSRRLKRENLLLENKVMQRTNELSKSLEDLKSAQSQLIQSEKMASLGQLTAGIAHEIQNPLNFVNNFSDVNKELLSELNEEMQKGNYDEAEAIAKNVIENEQKINHHGKKADAIVKNMLQHSRINSGKKESTDINALAEEYLRLSYHGFRANDKSLSPEGSGRQADIKTDFDNSIGKINIIPQDIGRVLVNLMNNAFYAASLPLPTGQAGSQEGFSDSDKKKTPTVWLSTKKENNKTLISVRDNGPGIPANILDKIFQPFFTTKPTGQGTGLGLSLAYDIVKAHGGELKVVTKEGEGAEFTIELPIQ